MKLTAIAIICCLATIPVAAQPLIKVHPEPYIGLSVPLGEEFSHVHAEGGAFGANVFVTLKEKFSIGPSYMLIYHQKNFNESAKEVTGGSYFGGIADYSISIFKEKLRVYPQIGFYKLGLSDYIGSRKDYNGDDLAVLTAKGNVLMIGGAIEYFRIRLSAHYRYAKLPVKFDKALFAEFAASNTYYTVLVEDPVSKMDFSSVTIQMGFRF